MSEGRNLSRQAYQPLPPGKEYEPVVPSSSNEAEVTLKAILLGVGFGILFGAANAYLGLQTGLTISTSVPIAVMTVAAFKALSQFGKRGTLLEANLSQTIGSASSSVASGTIFTLPALFLWGFDPDLLQMTLLGMCGGLLGILFMIPLRKVLIAKEHGKLPYPEGTACAEVLLASQETGGRAKSVFQGLFIGAALKAVVALFKAIPGTISYSIPFLPKAALSAKLSAALVGVGYILGPRVATIMVSGGLLSSLVIIPLIAYLGRDLTEPFYPETAKLIADMETSEIWNRYVRYIGAGAVAMAGLITLARSIPTMLSSFKSGLGSYRRDGSEEAASGSEELPRTQRDLSGRFVIFGITVIALALAFVPPIFGVFESFLARAIASVLAVLFAFFFVTVSSRIVGLVGVTSNPTSGMTIATLLGTSSVFLALDWTDERGKVAALTVGCVVAIAASIAGDTSQDLKTGFLLGGTPRRQQSGELLGVLTSAMFVALAVLVLDRQYSLGSPELPAPQGTLMRLVIDGVLDQNLPWFLVTIGAGIAIVVELFRLPSLAFAVGVYLPVATMMTVFFGGLLRLFMDRRASASKQEGSDPGVLFGSGLVGGEGLFGVLHAIVVVSFGATAVNIGSGWAGSFANEVALGVMVLLLVLFSRASRRVGS